MRRRISSNEFPFFKIFLGALVILPIILILYVLRTNLLAVGDLDVQENKVNCADLNQLKNSSKLSGQNILLINSTQVEEELKKRYFCVKRIEIIRSFPNRVTLKVFGREGLAILVLLKSEDQASSQLEKFSQSIASSSAEATTSANFNFSAEGTGENFVVDNEGIIFSTDTNGLNIPKIYFPRQDIKLGQKVREVLITNTLKILGKVKTYGVQVNDAKIYSDRYLLINAEVKIIFKLDERIDTQLASLQLILSQAKIENDLVEFIDLRFDKPIVRFAPKK